MKKILIIAIIMFNFFSKTYANYEQLAHEFSFKSIDGVKIGVLAGSLLSTVFGYFLLLLFAKR